MASWHLTELMVTLELKLSSWPQKRVTITSSGDDSGVTFEISGILAMMEQSKGTPSPVTLNGCGSSNGAKGNDNCKNLRKSRR